MVAAACVEYRYASYVTRVQSIDAALHTLLVFEKVAELQPVGVSELARAADIDKSRVQRILLTLNDANWIMPAPGPRRRWQVASRPLNILRRAGRLYLLERAVAQMSYLRDLLGETVFLSAPQGGRMVVLDAAKSTTPLRIEFNPGDSFSPQSASAVSILAALPEGSDPYLLEGQSDLDIKERVADARARHYAILDSGDFVAFAAAVPDETGFPFASLTVAAPTFRVTRAKRAEIVSSLTAAVSRCASPDSSDAGTPDR
jgi:IclR family acetate operon transcriptional repressor